ncbi:PorT family protein [Lewinella lacunae]|uniref:PorT family protein n=1 Tax=Neolewinella lacunae TaxID=1517758 RepID=A0A923T909_9BACT|nr:outer membrane beta-barrel protein [Neolewinella lacunae]MBC6995081.1 PorT family protein [Neolewinella lacunae]
MQSFLFPCFLFLLAAQAGAQRRFEAGLVLGANLSQVDGDAYAGYRRLGIETGIKGIVRLSDRFYFSVQWLYSQRGSRPSSREELRDFGNSINIGIYYVELPFLLHIAPGDKKKGIFPVELFTGFSVGRLIRSKIQETGANVRFYPFLQINEIRDQFNPTDLSHLVGIQYNVSQEVAFYLKHTMSLRNLYTPLDRNDPYNQLEPYYLTAGANYIWR